MQEIDEQELEQQPHSSKGARHRPSIARLLRRQLWPHFLIAFLASAALVLFILKKNQEHTLGNAEGKSDQASDGSNHSTGTSPGLSHGSGSTPSSGSGGIAYYEMKDIIVQLCSEDQEKFLRASLYLQVDSQATQDRIAALLPQIEDSIQSYLRQIRPTELSSSFGTYRIKGDLLLRVNTIIYPHKVEAVLIKDLFLK